MKQPTNPAGRLYKALDFVINKTEPKTLFRVAVERFLKEGHEDSVFTEFFKPFYANSYPFRFMAAISDTADEIERRVRAIDGIRHDNYLRWQPKFNSFVSALTPDQRRENYAAHFSDVDFSFLSNCDDYLDTVGADPIVAESQLQMLEKSALEMHASIGGEGFSPVILEYLTKHLECVINGIWDYRVVGFRALVDNVAESIGHFKLHENTHADARKSSFGKRVLVLGGGLLFLVSTAADFKELNLLPGYSEDDVKQIIDNSHVGPVPENVDQLADSEPND